MLLLLLVVFVTDRTLIMLQCLLSMNSSDTENVSMHIYSSKQAMQFISITKNSLIVQKKQIIGEEVVQEKNLKYKKNILILIFILVCFLFAYSSGILFFKEILSRYKTSICAGLLVAASFVWSCPYFSLEYSSLGIISAIVFSGILSDKPFGIDNAWISMKVLASICISPVLMLLLGSCMLSVFFRNNGGRDLILPYLLGGSSRQSLLIRCMLLSLALSGIISNITAPIIILSVVADLAESTNTTPDRAIIMCIAFSSNIGGMLLPISSPQSVLGSNIMKITWTHWISFSFPIAFVASAFVYILLLYAFSDSTRDIVPYSYNIEHINRKDKIKVIFATLTCIVCWAIVSIFSSLYLILFIPIAALSFGKDALDVCNKKTLEILSIAVAGIALGTGIEKTALLKDAIPSLILHNREHSLLFAIVVLSFFMLITSCIVCHTVSAAVILPILQKIGAALHREKLLLAVATLACSCGMALPSSGFPNILTSGFKLPTGKRAVSVLSFTLLGTLSTFVCWGIILSVGITCMMLTGL